MFLGPALTPLARAWELARGAAQPYACPLTRYLRLDPGRGGMSPAQRRFHTDQSGKRDVRAGNQSGKSHAGAAEAWWHALGKHPFRSVAVGPTQGLIVVGITQEHWPIVSEKLHDLEPRGEMHADCKYVAGKGYMFRGRRMVALRNGSTMVPKSGKQDVVALASGTYDWLWIDEPPRATHWGEAMSRVSVRQGPIWLTFTPVDVGQDLEWLRRKISRVDGHEADFDPGWSETVIQLTVQDCPHRSQESIEAQMAAYLPFERLQRTTGAWEASAAGRVFSNFDGTQEFTFAGWDSLPGWRGGREGLSFGLSADHGELAGAEYWSIYAYIDKGPDSVAWKLREYESPERTTIPQDARAIVQILDEIGLSLLDMSRIHGDINSAGKGSEEPKSVNQAFEQAFGEILQAPGSIRIRKPRKGSGSVQTGMRVVSLALGVRPPQFYVSRSCPTYLRTLRRWKGGTRGADGAFKHPHDAVAYGPGEILSPLLKRALGEWSPTPVGPPPPRGPHLDFAAPEFDTSDAGRWQ